MCRSILERICYMTSKIRIIIGNSLQPYIVSEFCEFISKICVVTMTEKQRKRISNSS